jgi:predicted Zn-dependent protease
LARRFFFGVAALVLAVALGGGAFAGTPTFLRDTEIEADIRAMMTPVWKAAGLDPEALHVYLVEDGTINSFVAGGPNEFLNSGLIMRAETPNQLIGVLAHETGHISGGHLSRAQQAMKNASIEGIIAMVLAAGAAAMSRGGEGGAALLGAAGVAERAWLQYSVTQEAAADQAALTFLDRTGQSARGLLQFFQLLEGEELLSGARQDPYLRSHPLTQQRIEYVRNHVEQSRFSNAPDTQANIDRLARIKAKLAAFISPPGTALAKYPQSDQSVLARYARAIAYYRIPDLDKALPIIDGLVRDYPKDPYFRELKGQMLFENGRIREAVQPYEEAVKLAPTAPLLRIALAQAYVEVNDPNLNRRAIAYLKDALRSEDKETGAWHLLATAYGRDDQVGMAALSLAEEALAGAHKKTALQQAKRAQQLLPKDSAAHARAEQIYRDAEEIENAD